jgi:hypothetical protein
MDRLDALLRTGERRTAEHSIAVRTRLRADRTTTG